MATKEEIWENKFKAIAGGIDYIITEFPTSWKIEEKLNEAMDEYSKQEAIELLKYLRQHNYQHLSEHTAPTDEEIYELFKQHQIKEK